MKTLIAVLAILLIGCGEEWEICSPGDMQCSGNTTQMCNEWNTWEDWQNCGEIGEQCYTSSAHCSGYDDIACCD